MHGFHSFHNFYHGFHHGFHTVFTRVSQFAQFPIFNKYLSAVQPDAVHAVAVLVEGWARAG